MTHLSAVIRLFSHEAQGELSRLVCSCTRILCLSCFFSFTLCIATPTLLLTDHPVMSLSLLLYCISLRVREPKEDHYSKRQLNSRFSILHSGLKAGIQAHTQKRILRKKKGKNRDRKIDRKS